MPELNWIAVIAAAVSAFILGGLWYGPLFGKKWIAVSGVDMEKAKEANVAKIYGLAFILSFAAAAVFAAFLGPDIDWQQGATYGFSAGLFWVAGALGINYLFEQKPLGLWLINGGYSTAMFTIFGAVIGAFN